MYKQDICSLTITVTLAVVDLSLKNLPEVGS